MIALRRGLSQVFALLDPDGKGYVDRGMWRLFLKVRVSVRARARVSGLGTGDMGQGTGMWLLFLKVWVRMRAITPGPDPNGKADPHP